MDFRSVKRVQKLKKLLERIAFASLFVDICVSVVTLISLNVGRAYTVGILFILSYILTIIVILSLVVFAAILLVSHYDKLINKLA